MCGKDPRNCCSRFFSLHLLLTGQRSASCLMSNQCECDVQNVTKTVCYTGHDFFLLHPSNNPGKCGDNYFFTQQN